MAHVQKRASGKYLVRWIDYNGKERSKQFALKRDADAHRAEVESQLNRGDYIDPAKAKMTLQEWSAVWLEGQRMYRATTYKLAKSNTARITKALGHRPLSQITVSEVRAWVASMQAEGLKPATVSAVHGRLKQIMEAAVDEGLLRRSPVGRKTSPATARRELVIPTTKQVWDLHDAAPAGVRPAILLAAFAGLRNAEAVALRVQDVDFLGRRITPKIQYGGVPLKTDSSRWAVPVAEGLTSRLAEYAGRGADSTLVLNKYGRPMAPKTLTTVVSEAAQAAGLPEGFRYHDLRHFYASLLISEGLDVVTVQHCLRHASANTTLGVYAHLWPDKDESARAAVARVMEPQTDQRRTSGA